MGREETGREVRTIPGQRGFRPEGLPSAFAYWHLMLPLPADEPRCVPGRPPGPLPRRHFYKRLEGVVATACSCRGHRGVREGPGGPQGWGPGIRVGGGLPSLPPCQRSCGLFSELNAIPSGRAKATGRHSWQPEHPLLCEPQGEPHSFILIRLLQAPA